MDIQLKVKKAEESMAAKLNTSKQFIALKRMMQVKSQEVVRVKRELAKHQQEEPVDADEEGFSVQDTDSGSDE